MAKKSAVSLTGKKLNLQGIINTDDMTLEGSRIFRTIIIEIGN